MRVEKEELLSMVDKAENIFVVSNATLFDAFIKIERKVVKEFIEHNYNVDTGMRISIRENDLYIEKLEVKK